MVLNEVPFSGLLITGASRAYVYTHQTKIAGVGSALLLVSFALTLNVCCPSTKFSSVNGVSHALNGVLAPLASSLQRKLKTPVLCVAYAEVKCNLSRRSSVEW